MSAGYSDIIPIIRLGRFRFLLLGLALYLLGALLAVSSGAPVHAGRLTMGYLILVTGHLSMHYSNDLFDYEADLRTNPNAVSGGSGILRDYPHLKTIALYLALFLAVLSMALGAAFTWLYSYPPVYVGLVLFSNLLGWYYAAPPIRLSYRGLGELATILGVGVLMPVAGALTMAGFVPSAFIAFLPALVLYSTSFIFSVEQPDMEADIASNKRTFVARKGRVAGFTIIACANLLATIYLAAMFAINGTAVYLAAGILSILPLAVGIFGIVRKPAGRLEATGFAKASVGCFMLFLIAMDFFMAVYLLLPK
ncbi:prenyltransferase [Methanocella sp. MCL-LM]|uniref:prenyltransferase n=1 Tax=Methanocella sp. MCL-LM TaxID=3412035 RepID=UPI003C706459